MSFLFLLALSLLIIGLGSFLLLALSWNEEKKELGLPINLFFERILGKILRLYWKDEKKRFLVGFIANLFGLFLFTRCTNDNLYLL